MKEDLPKEYKKKRSGGRDQRSLDLKENGQRTCLPDGLELSGESKVSYK